MKRLNLLVRKVALLTPLIVVGNVDGPWVGDGEIEGWMLGVEVGLVVGSPAGGSRVGVESGVGL